MRSACVWIVSLGSLVGVAAAGGAARAEHCGDGGATPSQVCTGTGQGASAWSFGFAWSRFAPEDAPAAVTGGARAITGEALRFGFDTTVNRHIYIGGEAEFGSIADGTGGDPIGARSTVSQPDPTPQPFAPLHGQFAAARALVGTRASGGFLSGGAELAIGSRVATYSANDWAGNRDQIDLLLEGRGRLDAWVTPNLTVGATAGIDLRNEKNVTLGLSVSVHFLRYDGTR